MTEGTAYRCGYVTMSEPQIEYRLRDASATEALGAALACALEAGGSAGSGVIYLHGDLGAGKTTCVRSLLRTLGVDGLIRSPTYTIVECYQPGSRNCIHVDLYRLGSPLEVEELGLRDYLESACIMLVEWPEKGGTALPPADLDVTLSYENDHRQARLDAITDRGRGWIGFLLDDTRLTPYVLNLT